MEHFSQANPEDEGQEDVAALLRKLAATIEELGDVEVQDIVFHMQLDDEAKDRPTATVYFHRNPPRPRLLLT